jgi:hypothetical protein
LAVLLEWLAGWLEQRYPTSQLIQLAQPVTAPRPHSCYA